jgi:hypothetical protein
MRSQVRKRRKPTQAKREPLPTVFKHSELEQVDPVRARRQPTSQVGGDAGVLIEAASSSFVQEGPCSADGPIANVPSRCVEARHVAAGDHGHEVVCALSGVELNPADHADRSWLSCVRKHAVRVPTFRPWIFRLVESR